MPKENISPSKVLFIKLGAGGDWEKECIKDNQTIKLGFQETNHNDCLNGNWEAISKEYLMKGTTQGATTNFKNQIKLFYTADDKTLWITFHKNQLWWCFANAEIYLEENKTKIRNVKGKWSNKDIEGNILYTNKISGKILRTRGFQGTICEIKAEEAKYLVNKINGNNLQEVKEARKNVENLKDNLTKLIDNLYWKDFEILIDMLFRQSGYQRIGMLGGQEKDIDLDLFSPIANEKIAVQIKAKTKNTEFQKYCEIFSSWDGYTRFFYVTQHLKIEESKFQTNNSKIKVLFAEDIAQLAINYGLIEWIIDKNS